jgi:hypothetical protein
MKLLCHALSTVMLFSLWGCRTLDPGAVKVQVIGKVPDSCKALGTVNVDWSWWGTSSESLNAMRNQVAEKGGNALLVQGDDVGLAYSCSEKDLTQ